MAVERSFGELDRIVTDELARTGVPGAAVAVVYGDEVVYTKGYGLREVGKPEEVDADIDIRVDNGLIRNERPLGRSAKESQGRVVGQLGTGGPLIKLRTSNGVISVH